MNLFLSFRRRSFRWFIVVFLLLIFIWTFFLFENLSIQTEQTPKENRPIFREKISQKARQSDRQVFLERNPVKYNYHIFYYPWYFNWDRSWHFQWSNRLVFSFLSIDEKNSNETGTEIHNSTMADFITGTIVDLHIGTKKKLWNIHNIVIDRPMTSAATFIRSSEPTVLDRTKFSMNTWKWFAWAAPVRQENPEFHWYIWITCVFHFSGTLSISWYPPGMADDEGHSWDDLIPKILDFAGKYELQVNWLRSKNDFHRIEISFRGLFSHWTLCKPNGSEHDRMVVVHITSIW